MAVRSILSLPNDEVRLRRRSRSLRKLSLSRLAAIAEDLTDTLVASEGLGLACPQIGVLSRAIAVSRTLVVQEDASGTSPRVGVSVYVNPVLTYAGELIMRPEECLSIPETIVRVQRHADVRLRGLCWRDGTAHEIDERHVGLMAVVLQHEVDHLDGILIVDNGQEVPTCI